MAVRLANQQIANYDDALSRLHAAKEGLDAAVKATIVAAYNTMGKFEIYNLPDPWEVSGWIELTKTTVTHYHDSRAHRHKISRAVKISGVDELKKHLQTKNYYDLKKNEASRTLKWISSAPFYDRISEKMVDDLFVEFAPRAGHDDSL